MAGDLLLGVTIKAYDMFSAPIKSMISQVTMAEGKFKGLTNTMKIMGKSKSEIDAINSSLNKMADQKAFANVASDLQKVGMAKQDIAAMESSYMRMAQYQRDMARTQEAYAAGKDMAMSGIGDVATGAVGIFGITEMVKQFGEFQSTMTVIQDATGATTKQINDLGDAIMSVSAKVSKFNDKQVAGFAQQLASGGFNKPSQIQSLLLPMAQYAEVQTYERKQSDPTEAVNQAIEMAHTFKHYDAKGLTNFLDTFNKYSLMQPGSSTALQQTLMYLAPTTFRQMHMSESDVMSLAALDNTIGLTGSHGGTSSSDMILRLIPGLVGGAPTKKKTPKAWQAMEDLGFIDKNGNSQFFDKKGNILNLKGMLDTMIADSKKMNPMQLSQKYHDIFGIQGGRAASILADPSTIERLVSMRKQLGTTKSMEKINKNLQAGPEGQLNLAASNSMTLMLRVAKQLAVTLTPAIEKVNDLLGSLLKFSQAHPAVNKLIGDFALFLVGSKMLQGVLKIVVGNFKMLGATVKMLNFARHMREMTTFGKILMTLGKPLTFVKDAVMLFGSTTITMIRGVLLAMGPVGWIITGVTAAVALLFAAWKTDFGGIRETTKKVINDIKKFFTDLFHGDLRKLPGDMLKLGGDIIHGLMNGIKAALGGLKSVVSGIGKTISGTFKSILGIKSPSRVFMEHGKFIVQGLSMGIDKNSHLANKSTVGLAKGVNNSFRPGNASLSLAGGGVVIQSGAIVINGGNANAEQIAEAVIQKLGKVSRRSMMNTGVTVNMGAF